MRKPERIAPFTTFIDFRVLYGSDRRTSRMKSFPLSTCDQVDVDLFIADRRREGYSDFRVDRITQEIIRTDSEPWPNRRVMNLPEFTVHGKDHATGAYVQPVQVRCAVCGQRSPEHKDNLPAVTLPELNAWAEAHRCPAIPGRVQ